LSYGCGAADPNRRKHERRTFATWQVRVVTDTESSLSDSSVRCGGSTVHTVLLRIIRHGNLGTHHSGSLGRAAGQGPSSAIRCDHQARRSCAHHVLVPFMAPSDITPAVLHRAQQALAEVRSFPFLLNAVGRFSETTYLAIAEPAPFIALTRAATEAFPGFRPYGGAHDSVVPHLTAAHMTR